MGQKVNPHGLRVGIIKDWDSRWYAEKDFADNLVEDDKIRKYIKNRLYSAGISRTEIERASDRVKIIIHTAKPGIVIGRGGSAIDELKKELEKLQKNLGGIKEMKKLPDAIFIVDPKKERICVQEAHALGIELIGIADTNCDPDELDYVIPGNDDAIRAVKLIVSKMADAVIEANQGAEALEEVAEEAAVAEEAEA
mgnify:CR=1 FL=1